MNMMKQKMRKNKAKKLYDMKLSIEQIIQATDLKKEEVEKLIKNIKK